MIVRDRKDQVELGLEKADWAERNARPTPG